MSELHDQRNEAPLAPTFKHCSHNRGRPDLVCASRDALWIELVPANISRRRQGIWHFTWPSWTEARAHLGATPWHSNPSSFHTEENAGSSGQSTYFANPNMLKERLVSRTLS